MDNIKEDEFHKKNLFELQKLNIEELSKYYSELRKYEFENKVPLKSIEIRKKIHSILVSIVKFDRLLSKESINIINDERINTNNPKIYACTHIGGNDVQRAFEAIQEPAYLFLGDPKGIYKDVSGLLLFLNGVICLETCDKQDRMIAKLRAIELLESGGNLLIYPEGAWNITPSLPVMNLYRGTVDIAKQTGADLIPMGIEQYEKNFYISIGKNIVTKDLKNINNIELNQILRDAMATEKWRIFESQGVYQRSKIKNITIDQYQQFIVSKCKYDFTVQDVYNTMYHDFSNPSPDEVFQYQKKLVR